MTKKIDKYTLIRPAGHLIKYTEYQIGEIKKCAEDPVYFITNYVYLKHPVKKRMLFNLYDYQKRLLSTYIENRKVIAMLGRQSGKSQTASAFLLHTAIFNSDQYIMICSNKQKSADDIMSRLWFSYEELPIWLKAGVTKNDARTKVFDNGSTVVALATTADSGRGASVSLLYLDELAAVRPSIADEFWKSISPTLATGGKTIITSTPKMDEDLFARLWFSAKPSEQSNDWENLTKGELDEDSIESEVYNTIFETNDSKIIYENELGNYFKSDDGEAADMGFASFYAPWTMVPMEIENDGTPINYRDEKYRFNEINFNGFTNESFENEYGCQFISTGNSLITGTAIAHHSKYIKKPLFIDRNNTTWYDDLSSKDYTSILVSMDPSGDGYGDSSVIQVMTVPNMEQVAEWCSNESNQVEQAKQLIRILKRIDMMITSYGYDDYVRIYYSVERNGIGIGVIRVLENQDLEKINGFMVDSTTRTLNRYGEKNLQRPTLNVHRGLVTTNSSKMRFALELKQRIESNTIKLHSKFLLSELKSFVRIGTGFGAESGKHDDRVMGMVLNLQLLDEVRGIEPDLDDVLTPDLIDDHGLDEEIDILIPSL